MFLRAKCVIVSSNFIASTHKKVSQAPYPCTLPGCFPPLFGQPKGYQRAPLSRLVSTLLHDFTVFAKKHEIRVIPGQKASLFLYVLAIEGSSLPPLFWTYLWPFSGGKWQKKSLNKRKRSKRKHKASGWSKASYFFQKKTSSRSKQVKRFISEALSFIYDLNHTFKTNANACGFDKNLPLIGANQIHAQVTPLLPNFFFKIQRFLMKRRRISSTSMTIGSIWQETPVFLTPTYGSTKELSSCFTCYDILSNGLHSGCYSSIYSWLGTHILFQRQLCIIVSTPPAFQKGLFDFSRNQPQLPNSTIWTAPKGVCSQLSTVACHPLWTTLECLALSTLDSTLEMLKQVLHSSIQNTRIQRKTLFLCIS